MENANFVNRERDGGSLRGSRARGVRLKWGHNDPAALLRSMGFDKVDVLDIRLLNFVDDGVRQRLARRLVRTPRGGRDNLAESKEELTFCVTAVKSVAQLSPQRRRHKDIYH